MLKSVNRGFAIAAVAGLAVMAAAPSMAVTLKVSVTNTAQNGGPTLTPLFSAFHDGGFDTFDSGAKASAGLELIAEDGDPSGIAGELAAAQPSSQSAVVFAPQGFAGAPVIEPGETGEVTIAVDGSTNRFFSFLSMILPSNDAFIGNSDPMAYELFDASGSFLGPQTISVTGAHAYDAGTELNIGDGSPFQGAFLGDAQDENGYVSLSTGIDLFAGISLPNGATLDADQIGFGGGNSQFALATIQVEAVPVPAALPLMLGGLGLMGFAARRRQRS